MDNDFDPYKVRIKGVLVDPCAIGEAYRMSPTLFQSVKKLLRIGKKHKSEAEDIFQSVTSIFRWVDIHKEDNPELEDFFEKVKKEIEERGGELKQKMKKTDKAKRVICWFSCGAASAVATKIALKENENCEVVYQDTGAEHPDNKRFMQDCESWFGTKIKIIKSDKYDSVWDVFEKERYLVGVHGARCTSEMKRRVAENYINHFEDDEVFGYTIEEKGRIENFITNNPERRIVTPLINHSLTKADCLNIIEDQGIKLPAMYLLGFKNNNCIGCVKGGAGYWNMIRKHFPEVFERMAKLEREIGAAINKRYEKKKRIRVFLDELPEDAGRGEKIDMTCGLFCQSLDLK